MVRLKRMTIRILFALAALLLAGCSTFDKAELAQIRQRGVRPGLLYKMEHRRELTPEDVIELKRAGVRDPLIVKQLRDVGVNYVVSRGDVKRLRAAGVSAWVIDVLLRESERFAGRAYENPYDDYYGAGFYGAPYNPWFYSDWSIGYERFGRGWHDHRR